MSDEQAKKAQPSDSDAVLSPDHTADSDADGSHPAKEIGGRSGPDPTRFGDWEKNGRCIDF
jgi:hypothetical protein